MIHTIPKIIDVQQAAGNLYPNSLYVKRASDVYSGIARTTGNDASPMLMAKLNRNALMQDRFVAGKNTSVRN